MYRTSDPYFGLFEVLNIKSGDDTCFEVSETDFFKKPNVFEALVRKQMKIKMGLC